MDSYIAKLLGHKRESKRKTVEPSTPPVDAPSTEEVAEPVLLKKYWRDQRTFFLVRGVLPLAYLQALEEEMEKLRRVQEDQMAERQQERHVTVTESAS